MPAMLSRVKSWAGRLTARGSAALARLSISLTAPSPTTAANVCSQCGCSDPLPCIGLHLRSGAAIACHWIDDDLCSICAAEQTAAEWSHA